MQNLTIAFNDLWCFCSSITNNISDYYLNYAEFEGPIVCTEWIE
jgi:hypothetical protein